MCAAYRRKTTQLAIPDLSLDVSVQDLLNAFCDYIEKVNCVKINRKAAVRNEGACVGYVEFEDVFTTERARGDGVVEICGEMKTVNFAKRKNSLGLVKKVSEKKIFVSGISESTDRERLCELLGDCSISESDKGKNYAFAEYPSAEKRDEALRRLDGAKAKEMNVSVMPAYERTYSNNLNVSGRKEGKY